MDGGVSYRTRIRGLFQGNAGMEIQVQRGRQQVLRQERWKIICSREDKKKIWWIE